MGVGGVAGVRISSWHGQGPGVPRPFFLLICQEASCAHNPESLRSQAWRHLECRRRANKRLHPACVRRPRAFTPQLRERVHVARAVSDGAVMCITSDLNVASAEKSNLKEKRFYFCFCFYFIEGPVRAQLQVPVMLQ